MAEVEVADEKIPSATIDDDAPLKPLKFSKSEKKKKKEDQGSAVEEKTSLAEEEDERIGEGDVVETVNKGEDEVKEQPKVDGIKGKRGSKRVRNEPATPTIERPSREKKSIERFTVSSEKDKVREFKIEKGTGTPLASIPNVVYRLSKKTGSDDILQLLHKLLFGKRVKTHNVKHNILQFSGFVWGQNPEREKAKVKERFEKCVKDSLLQITDLLDMSIPKTGSKKEDVIGKLLEFLESPHKTTFKLVEEIDQKRKGKRKSPGRRSAKGSAAKRRKTDSLTKGNKEEEEYEFEAEDDDDEESPIKKRRLQKIKDDKSPIVKLKKRKINEKVPTKGRSKVRSTAKKVESPKKDSAKEGKLVLKIRVKGKPQEVPASSSGKTTSKGKSSKGETTSKAKEKGKKPTSKKTEPSEAEMRSAIRSLLEEADFSKHTFNDIASQLEDHLKMDLSDRRSLVKDLIREEIANMAAEDEDGDDDSEIGEEEHEPSEPDEATKE